MDRHDQELKNLFKDLRNEKPSAEDFARWRRVVPKAQSQKVPHLSWIRFPAAIAAGFLLGWLVFTKQVAPVQFENASNDIPSSQVGVNYIQNN